MRSRLQNIVSALGNIKFCDWLLNLGNGLIPNVRITTVPDAPSDLIEIPNIFQADSIEELLLIVYQNDFSNSSNGSKAILCPTNRNVTMINNKILANMTTSEVKLYVSIDEYDHHDDDLHVPQSLLNSIDLSSLPPHELYLRIGCIVILIKNLDIEQGQCNGSRYIITKLDDHYIEVEALHGLHKGQRLYLPKLTLKAKSTLLPKEMKRTQFPIKLAYAMTINKSQVQTLDKIGIYLQKPCFTHGQLYVAFSRVSMHKNIKIFIEDRNDQGTFKFRYRKRFTRNCILKSILSDSIDDLTLIENIRNLQVIYNRSDEETLVEEENEEEEDDEEVDVRSKRSHETQQKPPPIVSKPTITTTTNEAISTIVNEFLKARVSTRDQPGTSGLNFHPIQQSSRIYDNSDSD